MLIRRSAMIESINVSIVPITDIMNGHIAIWGYVSSLITQNIIVDLSAVNRKHENRCSFNERCGNDTDETSEIILFTNIREFNCL